MVYLIPIVFFAVWIPSLMWARRGPDSYRTARPTILYVTSATFAVLSFLEHRPLTLVFSLLFALFAADASRRMRVHGPITPD